MEKNVGGSDVSPSDASSVWQKQIEPLKKLGIKVGAPVVSGSPVGYKWLKDWEEECDGKCNPDFMPVHWYGPFEGLASWIGNMTATYPGLEIWITEFGLPNAKLNDTQSFFNESLALLDGWRYSLKLLTRQTKFDVLTLEQERDSLRLLWFLSK
jgi:hypothetical protein